MLQISIKLVHFSIKYFILNALGGIMVENAYQANVILGSNLLISEKLVVYFKLKFLFVRNFLQLQYIITFL